MRYKTRKKHTLSPVLSVVTVLVALSPLIALAQILSLIKLLKPRVFQAQEAQTSIKTYSDSAAANLRLQNARRASGQNQINHNDYSIRPLPK